MKKSFSKALALALAALMVVGQMVFVSTAVDVAELTCRCDASVHSDADEFIDHVDATCSEVGYDVLLCAECGGKYADINEEPTGNHDWNIPAADCENDSYCTYCGEVNEEALGHDLETVTVEATCTEPGETYEACSRCDFETPHTGIDPLGHDEVVTEIAPSCTPEEFLPGEKKTECNRCDWEEIEVLPAPTEHLSLTETLIEPDCENAGYYHYVCTHCGFELNIVSEEHPAVGHDLVQVEAQAATCTEIGWNAYEYCTVCDYTTYEEIPAHDHQRGEAVEENRVFDNCLEGGSYDVVVYCTCCGEELSRDNVEIPAYNEHIFDITVYAPTCIADGYTHRDCTRCNYEDDVDVVPADTVMGHDGELSGRVESTCAAEGWTGDLVCKLCGKTLHKGETIEKKDHVIQKYPAVAPTCLVDGNEAYEACDNCDYTTIVVIPATGHSLAYVDAKAPGCEEIGWNAYEYCTVEDCDYTTYVEIPALGHDWQTAPAKPVTCTEDGWDAYEYCAGPCGDHSKRVIIPAPGHTLEYVDAKAPTCEEIGWDAYEYCTVCDYTTYVELPATGHDFANTLTKVEPTCTTEGRLVQKCVLCDLAIRETITPALGHTLEVVPAKPATCTEGGWNEYKRCTVCDYDEYGNEGIITGPNGHNEVDDPAVDATCTENGLTAGVHCDVCGEVFVRQEKVPATGHDYKGEYEIVEDVAPTCTQRGYVKSVLNCVTCGEKLDETLTLVPATGHTEVETIIPATVDSIGYVQIECSVCGEILGKTPIDEEINFTYKIFGINGADSAVNSGTIYVEIYANVTSDYARIHGLDFAFNYDSYLSYISYTNNPDFLDGNLSVYGDDETGMVKLTANVNSVVDVVLENGEYLVATLSFRVDEDFYYEDAVLEVALDECEISRDNELHGNAVVATYDEAASIYVVMLGDGNCDGKINTIDDREFFDWFANAADGEYNTIFDMDKDGDNDEDDNALLRGAIVGVTDYLDM